MSALQLVFGMIIVIAITGIAVALADLFDKDFNDSDDGF